ncbi:MAG: hypothetical protein FWB86_01345 [Treponema sp.]|nr:hypothetical protein [Treponema sp.]MCL2250370.1 hypothetical protein [Treponema sp.]
MLKNQNEKNINLRLSILILLAFLAGCIFTGYIIYRERFTGIGILDSRYDRQHARAAEIIGRLEEELGRERELNIRLREYNNRARDLTDGLASSAERNVRNLQDAITIIGEIRQKLKVLADFYNNSDPGNSAD